MIKTRQNCCFRSESKVSWPISSSVSAVSPIQKWLRQVAECRCPQRIPPAWWHVWVSPSPCSARWPRSTERPKLSWQRHRRCSALHSWHSRDPRCWRHRWQAYSSDCQMLVPSSAMVYSFLHQSEWKWTLGCENSHWLSWVPLLSEDNAFKKRAWMRVPSNWLLWRCFHLAAWCSCSIQKME